eukprot:TRINITY_DN4466_c0_g1_i2.p4 TRINITY_DN4466_c0_g1~~TRINITY_DN4466_c0_g1_i2.p4  ORF type:complete len:158 (-),score=28.45 TRINITY_DN4466_c0_g1_i2:483-956(-)
MRKEKREKRERDTHTTQTQREDTTTLATPNTTRETNGRRTLVGVSTGWCVRVIAATRGVEFGVVPTRWGLGSGILFIFIFVLFVFLSNSCVVERQATTRMQRQRPPHRSVNSPPMPPATCVPVLDPSFIAQLLQQQQQLQLQQQMLQQSMLQPLQQQ